MNRRANRHLVCRTIPGLYLAALFIMIGPPVDAESPAQGTLSGTVLDPEGARCRGPGFG